MSHIVVFQGEENASGVQIGRATSLSIRSVGGLAPRLSPVGNIRILKPDFGEPPLQVKLVDFKTSQPVQGFGSLLHPNANREVRDRDLVIAALVHMLGGSVTISLDEMTDASKWKLTSYQVQEPRMIVIKTEEK